VRNTGRRDGDEVVFLFDKPPPGATSGVAPFRQLVDYQRVHVQAGRAEAVTLRATRQQLVGGGLHGARELAANRGHGEEIALRVEF
jgi:hypothetical protein